MKQRKTNRRKFLAGGLGRTGQRDNSMADVAGVSGTGQRGMSSDDSPANYLEHYTTAAMGCQFEVLFPYRRFRNAAEVSLEIFEQLERLEDIMSIYRPHSELSQINAAPAGTWRPVSDDLFSVLELALSIADLTNGAFDPTARPLSNVWGFSRREGKIPDPEQVQLALGSVGHQQLELDRTRCAVRKKNESVTVDLGAIGKGYALDRCRDLLLEHQLTDAIIHGGQSSVVALGSEEGVEVEETAGATGADSGWTIGISHPLIPNHRLGTVRLSNRALATSGSGRQGFVHAGRRYGHVIDPRTGWPPDRFLSVTLIGDNSAECDALATAFFVMTPDEIESICEKRPELGVILVHRSETAGALRVQSFNLGPDQWHPNSGAREWESS